MFVERTLSSAYLLKLWPNTPSDVLSGCTKLIAAAHYHFYTVLLFTWTDYKTIFFPITTFACATAPLRSPSNLVHGCLWVWMHLVMCNVSNQARGKAEDIINRPWRPLPSGRVTQSQAIALRWITVVLSFLLSATYSIDLVPVTAALVATTLLYDECGWAGGVISKNFCNIGGYVSFEVGATKIMGSASRLDITSMSAVALSGIIIFTTVQAQDFPDVEGDAASGRVTFPIYAPQLSRVFTLLALITWSIILGWFWGIGTISKAILAVLGTFVGIRYYLWRTQEADKCSYRIFNVWLTAVHLLALHARKGVFAF